MFKFFDYQGHFPSLHQGDEIPEWPKILETPFTFVTLVFLSLRVENSKATILVKTVRSFTTQMFNEGLLCAGH